MTDSVTRDRKAKGTGAGRPTLSESLEKHQSTSDGKITRFLSGKSNELTPSKRKRGNTGKSGISPESDEEKRRAKKEKREKETKWMSEKEKKIWGMMEKKMEEMVKSLRDELMEIWDYETREREEQIEERDKKIRELEDEIRVLKGKVVEKEQKGDEEVVDEEVEDEEPELWSKVLKSRRKKREEIIDALDDIKVQRKMVKVSEEVQDKKRRENNIVVKGWSEIESVNLGIEEKKDAMKVGKEFLGKYLHSKAGIQEAEWYGKENRKVLVLKMESREGKSEVLKRRGNLKGTKIFLEDDLTREERKVQSKILKIRKECKKSDKDFEVWVRKGKMRINGKWYSWEELREKKDDERERLARLEEESEEESEEEIEEPEQGIQNEDDLHEKMEH